MITAKQVDYAVYGVLERLVGERITEPFHPLNRHPMYFPGDAIELGEQFGGPDDGAPTLTILEETPVVNEGGSRLRSWLWTLFHYRQARQELDE